MPAPVVPPAVRELLVTVTDSFEKLHTLVALFRRERGASLDELQADLDLPEHTVLEAVTDLQRTGTVTTGPGRFQFRYAAGDSARNAGVAWLSSQLDNASIEIVKLLNRTALDRVRCALSQRLGSAAALGPTAPADRDL